MNGNFVNTDTAGSLEDKPGNLLARSDDEGYNSTDYMPS
jgi:hypothetical protein